MDTGQKTLRVNRPLQVVIPIQNNILTNSNPITNYIIVALEKGKLYYFLESWLSFAFRSKGKFVVALKRFKAILKRFKAIQFDPRPNLWV